MSRNFFQKRLFWDYRQSGRIGNVWRGGCSDRTGSCGCKIRENIARQPEAQGTSSRTMIVGMAISENNKYFVFNIAIVLLLANPLIRLL